MELNREKGNIFGSINGTSKESKKVGLNLTGCQ